MAVFFLRYQRPVGIQANDLGAVLGHRRQKILLGQQHRHLRVLQGQSQPLGRISRIERDISRARLLDAQQPDHHVERSLDKNPHTLSASNAATLQQASHLVGLLVQGSISDRRTFKHAGHGAGCALDLLFEQLMNTKFLGIVRFS